MVPTRASAAALAYLIFCVAGLSAAAPAVACEQWQVPAQFTSFQNDIYSVTFRLRQRGQSIFGFAAYGNSSGQTVANVGGTIVGDVLHMRVLWTYSGVSEIGNYTGRITPRGSIDDGTLYHEYARDGQTYTWHMYGLTCPPPPTPTVALGRVMPRDGSPLPDVCTAAASARQRGSPAAPGLEAQCRALHPPVLLGRVQPTPETEAPPRTLCEAARDASARGSPAAPGLERQCRAWLASVPPPVDAPPPATAAPDATAIEALHARGNMLADQDARYAALRSEAPDAAATRGVCIGLAAAEGQTLPGPGKQRIHDALPVEERAGYDRGVAFSLERNRNADLAARGAVIADVDTLIAGARLAEPDLYFQLGFDVASGLFGDPSLGARGNTASGPGSLGIRNALSPAGQRGFDASMRLHLARDYRAPAPATGATP